MTLTACANTSRGSGWIGELLRRADHAACFMVQKAHDTALLNGQVRWKIPLKNRLILLIGQPPALWRTASSMTRSSICAGCAAGRSGSKCPTRCERRSRPLCPLIQLHWIRSMPKLHKMCAPMRWAHSIPGSGPSIWAAAINNHRTRRADLDLLLAEVLRLGQDLQKQE